MIHWAYASVLHGNCIGWTKMSAHKGHSRLFNSFAGNSAILRHSCYEVTLINNHYRFWSQQHIFQRKCFSMNCLQRTFSRNAETLIPQKLPTPAKQLVPKHTFLPLLQPASDLVLSLLKDAVVQCMSCNTVMRLEFMKAQVFSCLHSLMKKEQQLGVTEEGHLQLT